MAMPRTRSASRPAIFRRHPLVSIRDAAMADFPHSLTIALPLPSPRLATILSDALSVDEELSPLVRRTFETDGSNLVVRYSATTARMLRVSTNGVFESIKTLLETFQELDVDVLEKDG